MPYKDIEKKKANRKAYREANREAAREATRKWRAANPEASRKASRKWYAANREAEREATRKWCAANPEASRKASRKYRAAHPEKGRAKDARRRALKSRACPPWADRKAIEAIYADCPEGHHVDHIHPLKGRHWKGTWEPGDSLLWLLELPDDAEDIFGNPISTRVSIGLHIPVNLMPLPDTENVSKGNQAPQPGYFDWFGHSLVNGLHV